MLRSPRRKSTIRRSSPRASAGRPISRVSMSRASGRIPKRCSKPGATPRTKHSASVCRSSSAASAPAASSSRMPRWRARRPRSRSRRSRSDAPCGSPTSSWSPRPRASGHDRASRVRRAHAQRRARSLRSPARRHGSKRCRRNSRWRRPTTNRKRRAGVSKRRASSSTRSSAVRPTRRPIRPTHSTSEPFRAISPRSSPPARISPRSIARSTKRSRGSGSRARCARRTRRSPGGMLFDSPPGVHLRMEGRRWRSRIPVFTRHERGCPRRDRAAGQLRAQREARLTELTGQATAAAARAQAARRRYLALSRRNRSAAVDHRVHGRGLVSIGADRLVGVSAGDAGRARSAAARHRCGSRISIGAGGSGACARRTDSMTFAAADNR